MISIELWRARIGLFNNKRPRGRSGFLSSLFFFAFFHNCHRKNVRTRDTASAVDCFPSSSSSVLVAEERPTTDDRLSHHTFSAASFDRFPLTFSSSSQRDHSTNHSSTSSAAAGTTFSFSSSAGGGVFSLRRSLLYVLIILLITIISQLLIMSGDIETNPGPRRGGEYMYICDLI